MHGGALPDFVSILVYFENNLAVITLLYISFDFIGFTVLLDSMKEIPS